MRWGEFKQWVEDRGVNDDTEIEYIDIDEKPTFIDLNRDVGGSIVSIS